MQAPSNAGSAAAAAAAPLKGVFFHTHNVARALKPSGDGELAHALHETLHFALDGEEEDWGPQRDMLPDCGDAVQEQQQQPQSGKASQQGDQEPTPRPGFFPTGNPERPYISYAWNERTSTLSLPNPTTIFNPTKLDPCSPEQRSAFDVTVKFFYLPQSDEGDAVGAGAGAGAGVNGTASGIGEEGKERYPKHYIDDALKRLTMATSLITFDTFIIAFPGLALDAGGHKNGSGAPVCGAGGAAAADVSEITTNGTSNGANGTQEEVPERLRENVEEVRKIWEVSFCLHRSAAKIAKLEHLAPFLPCFRSWR